MRISNIIFDFGEVIIRIDFEAVSREIRKYGVTDVDGLHRHLINGNYYLDLETGEISAKTFRDAIRSFTGNHLPDQQIDAAWNAMILDIPAPRVRLLEQLRSGYRTFLLSNTNEIHYRYYDRYFADTFGYNHLADLFEEAYFSHEMRQRKPDPAIYRVVLEKHGLVPEQTLFIDDVMENIEAANALGIIGYHLKQGEDITTLFDEELKFTGFVG